MYFVIVWCLLIEYHGIFNVIFNIGGMIQVYTWTVLLHLSENVFQCFLERNADINLAKGLDMLWRWNDRYQPFENVQPLLTYCCKATFTQSPREPTGITFNLKKETKTGTSYKTWKDDFEIVLYLEVKQRKNRNLYFAKKKTKAYRFYNCYVKNAHWMGIYLSQKCYNAKKLFCKI